MTDGSFEGAEYDGIFGLEMVRHVQEVRGIAARSEDAIRKMIEMVDQISCGDPMHFLGKHYTDEER